MAQATVRGGFDTFAGSINPSREHGDAKFLTIQADTQYAYVYLKNPVPRGATVVSAKLRVRARGAWAGTQTLKVRRIADSWKASKLNWNNKPGVTGVNQPTATVGAVSDGTVIEFDVTVNLQTVVNGSPHYGWRIETDGPQRKLYGFDAGDNKPTLTVVWSHKPAAPTSLNPSSGAVSVAKPVLQFDYNDTGGDDLEAVHVQVDPAGNASSPAFDSGTVTTTEPELDLNTTAYAGLADGASTKWRVRAKDAGGVWSDWSDWASFSRDAKGTLTLDSPSTTSAFVWEPTPPILATLTGESLTAYQVRITAGDDQTKVLYDSGKVKASGTSIAHTIPFRHNGRRVLRDDVSYWLNVRAWDTKNREATPGDPVFIAQWLKFTVDNDPGINGVTGVTAAQEGTTPWVKVEWDRATAADGYVIWRNDVRVARLDPEDVIATGGTHYTWRDVGATPYKNNDYRVQAIENGRGSAKSGVVTVKPTPEGVWVIDFDRDKSFALAGVDIGGWRMVDQGTTYRPIGSSRAVRITIGQHGLEGSFTGDLEAAEGRTAASFERDFYAIKEHPDQVVQLVAADLSIPVVLSNMSLGPHPDTTPDDVLQLVSFDFFQAGDLPFESRI